jgi:hypothetical protein
MDPITLALIGMGIGAVGKAASGAIQASSIYTKADKERLEELKRLQDLNALGLTEEETAVLQEQMYDPVAAMQAQRNQQRRELASAANLGSGAVAKQMMQEEEQSMRLDRDVSSQLAQLNLQQKKLQEQEIKDLEKARDVKNKAMLAAAVGGAGDIGAAAFGAKAQQMQMKELTGQASQLSAAQQAQFQQQMMQQQYMRNFYGQGYDPYFSYYQNYYGAGAGGVAMPFVPGYTPTPPAPIVK